MIATECKFQVYSKLFIDPYWFRDLDSKLVKVLAVKIQICSIKISPLTTVVSLVSSIDLLNVLREIE